MGEVYRARDTRLKREVAIKVLRAGGGNEAALLRRLEQEARTLAALNHSNLVAIHDTGEHDDGIFLVMELLDGETLRTRLQQGSVPMRRALEYARQIAQGLAAAHAAGVVHRDLKPENIMLTAEGRVKILDFGLARTVAAVSADAETLTSPVLATAAGVVLGTVGYMAPEQVRGEPAGVESDIFAFGAIVYEMLAGRRAFQAATPAETMSAILRDEPPEITVGSATLAPAVDRIVRRCLEKNPRQRFQSAADLDFALAALAEASSTSLGAPAAAAVRKSSRRSWRTPLWIALAAIIAGAISALFMLDRGTPTISVTQLRTIALNVDRAGGFWSPDGKSLAYAAAPAPHEPNQIFLYLAGNGQPEQLTQMPGAMAPMGWSADGQDVIFVENQYSAPKVWSVAAVGGAPQLLMDLGHPKGGAFALSVHGDALAAVEAQPDGTIGVGYSEPIGQPLRWYAPKPFAVASVGDFPTLVFSPDGSRLLLELPTSQGAFETWLLPFPPRTGQPPRRVLADLPPHDLSPKLSWMPDGRHVLITCFEWNMGGSVWEANPDSGAMRLVARVPGGYKAQLAPGGRALALIRYYDDTTIVSADLHTAAVTPWVNPRHSSDQPAWAAAVPEMAYLDYRNSEAEIWIREQTPDGTTNRELISGQQMGAPGWFFDPTPSPRGHRVAFSFAPTVSGRARQAIRLWVAAVAGGAPIPLIHAPGFQVDPAWSPDGSQIVYLDGSGAVFRLMLAPTTGNAQAKVLKPAVGISTLFDEAGPAWSPDGKRIAFVATDGLVHIIAPDGSGGRVACRTPLAVEAFSADSRSLYGIVDHGTTADLVEVPLATSAVRIIGSLGDNLPGSSTDPGWRFTLAPGGQSVTYNTGIDVHELDLVTPFSLSGHGAARLRHWLHLP